ncbi:phosphopyruvate hydratase [Candidatus Avelusimicrobium gallicola]|uniref:Enolase n=1 Tax=Candidatus Avelusimicrobium gallicola TaxID=2562704 RepID=A0A1Y4DEJ2_9BACT|nr:phosphopyruvate hydratase [Elusimicrobium sp. An273]OUO56129.1 phosphopyruvate hydratase [Elusimicrobium sp. An273]
MARIKKITAREILDSRGYPTVAADVLLDDGNTGTAAVPSGASTGSHEALELRDGGERYNGKGVLNAVKNVERISQQLAGMDPFDIRLVDESMIALDGTENKSHLGANAMLAVSMAVLRAGCHSAKLPLYQHIRNVYGLHEDTYVLPAPMLNIVNGGKHADSGLDVQEFMIVPTAPKTFAEALREASETYHALRNLLKSEGMVIAVGDEGGFAPKISKHEDVLKTILAAAKKAGHPEISLAMDCAASEFYHEGAYRFEGKMYSAEQMTDLYAAWCKAYPLISIEDPLQEDDWEGWKLITQKLGKKINLVGDDLFVTNLKRLEKGIAQKAANSILIKVNQIGTVSETIDVMELAKKNGYSRIVSHRSGETEDTFIADLAVATNAGAIKTGAPARAERTAKYNRLLQIEAELGEKAVYAQNAAFKK